MPKHYNKTFSRRFYYKKLFQILNKHPSKIFKCIYFKITNELPSRLAPPNIGSVLAFDLLNLTLVSLVGKMVQIKEEKKRKICNKL